MSSGDRRPTAADLLGADMPVIDPLCCEREQKAGLESAGNIGQLEYIGYLVTSGIQSVRESHVLKLHELAIEGIYPCAGAYRDARSDVYLEQARNRADHELPDPAGIPGLVREALDRLERDRENRRNAIDRAAYALWRFNWIHPFNGGNGRTARAIAYLVVCIDSGNLLLGSPTMPTYIAEHADEYVDALRRADAAARTGIEDLSAMKRLVLTAFVEQMRSVLDGT